MITMQDHHELLEKPSSLLIGHVAFVKDSAQPRIVEDPQSNAVTLLRYHLN